jgi:D-proline reductase (dithiol) PrdB
MSRRAIPYAPARLPLSDMVIALVDVAGVYVTSQEPFNLDSDTSIRVIPGDVDSSQLAISHAHYDHADADRDVNLVFPIDRLRELAEAGQIGGVADKHYSLGYSANLREMYENVCSSVADAVERSRTDAVLLTAGCPNVCHRTVVAVAREIEMRGLPTVVLTVSPEATRLMGPPRALFPGFTPGHATGLPYRPDLQRHIVLDALGLLVTPMEPGQITERGYSTGM